MWDSLKNSINNVIKTNGNQEITGQVLQSTLNSIVDTVGEGATFAGVATPSTNPGSPDGPVFYIAVQAGTYSNFGGITVSDAEIYVFLNGTTGPWTGKKIIDVRDSVVNSRELTDTIHKIVEEIAVLEAENTTAELDLAFGDSNGNDIVQFSGGHVKTKNFNSESVNSSISELSERTSTSEKSILSVNTALQQAQEKISNAEGVISDLSENVNDLKSEIENTTADVVTADNNDADYSVSDEQNIDIVRLYEGHIKTKYFDSKNVNSSIATIKDEVEELKKSSTQELTAFSDNMNGTTGVNPITNSDWSGWSEQRYSFGFNSRQTPFYNKSFTISDGTIICAGDTTKLRWGFHVFEGYASDKKSRITMLVNKHSDEEGKPLAELYYYLTAYNHHEQAYGYFKIGSDVRQHSFMFSRDKAVMYGSVDCRSLFQFASLNISEDILTGFEDTDDVDSSYEPEGNYQNNAKGILYLALRDARDGSMFYDNQREKLVVMINGAWHDVQTEQTPEGTYNF